MCAFSLFLYFFVHFPFTELNKTAFCATISTRRLRFPALGYRNRSMSETRSSENKRHTLAGPPMRSPMGEEFRKKDKPPVPTSPANFAHPYPDTPDIMQQTDSKVRMTSNNI